ncbi:C-terminal binding protein [Marinomonas algarum]|uniref:C-terminal binding protein n=1 Tax=Marinomonas algarum TaxID=2883105 RepID=A0A9X1IMX7_9GAMM|nr:C-terminal binding protein [Marinomonas algarum]MCB5162247.1 C-terminal binding protein [Marinomonas algarum]
MLYKKGLKMSSKKKVMYYNMPGDLNYEHELLAQWGITDLELIQTTGQDLVADVETAHSLTLEYTEVDEATLSRLPNLKIIALQSVGYNEIDVMAARKKSIYVTNTPNFCAYEVASHAMALLLNLSRHIRFYNQQVTNQDWHSKPEKPMTQLQGKTCGLVSLGAIPQALIPMLKGFGVNVVCFSKTKEHAEIRSMGITPCHSLDELLSVSDIVSLHTPLTESSRHMMNADTFAKMKEGAILLNTARGELIEENALIDCLKTGKISAAGLDVLTDEVNYSSELVNMNNVIVTPHIGYLSEESILTAKRICLEQIVMCLSKNTIPTHTVNPPL